MQQDSIGRKRIACSVFVLFAMAFVPDLASAEEESKEIRILLRDFESLSGTEATLAAFEMTVLSQLQGREGYSAYTFKTVRESLKAGCESDCLAEAVDKMSPNYLLYGSVGLVSGDRVVSLTLIDIETMRPIGGASGTFGTDPEILAATPALLGQTFGWPDAPRLETQTFSLPTEGQMSFALMDLSALGLEEDQVKNMTQVLSSSLKQIEGARIVTQEDIRAMLELEASKQVLGCSDTSCVAEIGAALGVDRMITGSVGLMGDRYVVSLRLINPREGTVDARVTESFAGDPSQLIPAVRYGGKQLLGALGDARGSIAVSANEESAAVFVNDEERGEVPMQALGDLEPGRYSLRLAKSGYYDWRSDVFVEPGGVTPVWAEMSERPPRFYETWWFWTAVGVVAVGAGTFYVVNATALPNSDLGNVSF